MFDRDMPVMRSHALKSPEGLTDVIAFVLCTIRQPLQTVAAQMSQIRTHGATAPCLFGSKRAGYSYAIEHRIVLHGALLAAVKANDTLGFVDVISSVPGLGIVKASFVAQICGFEVACLDGHNLKRLGLAEETFKLAKTVKPETRRKKIAAYIEVCQTTGGSRHWWNSWCEFVAGNRSNKSLATADTVSAYHASCLLS